MLSQIGDAIPHGADALGGNLFLPDGGGALHFRQIRIKQQRTVMHDFAAQSILCGAGKFASGHGQVVAAVEFGGTPNSRSARNTGARKRRKSISPSPGAMKEYCHPPKSV